MDIDALGTQLRNLRNQKFSELSAAVQNNSISAQQICYDWSQFADFCLLQAFNACFDSQEYALFSLGKLGAEELNLSSDIDIVIVSRGHQDSSQALRKFIKIIGDITSEGFVFRLDFDLRPGGRMGSLIPTVEQFVDYYGNYGETWERLALLRLRPSTGSPEVIQTILDFRNRFSFRRHIDLSLFEDFKNLRFNIQNENRILKNNEIGLKLGPGGIRDIELFTQCLQIINGGKNKALQTHSTDKALKIIEQLKIIPPEHASFLRSHYWMLRSLENYVQRHNQQTHILNESEQYPDFMKPFVKDLRNSMEKCHLIVKDLIGENPTPKNDLNEVPVEVLAEINDISLFSRHRQKDLLQRNIFTQKFAQSLKTNKGNWQHGFENLLAFLKSTKAKTSFYILLNRNPSLIEEIAWLFGHSPYLSQILCLRPELLDSYIFKSIDLNSESLEEFLEKAAEFKLVSELVNGSHFLKTKDLKTLTDTCTEVADKILIALQIELRNHYPSKIEVLCLGKWGTRELGLKSDLDFILVTPDKTTEEDLKFCRRLISRLTESHRGGSIYAVDMRLRPSGKAGPLVISASELQNYLRTSIEPWEKQIYLKSRWLQNELFSLPEALAGFSLSAEEILTLEGIRTQLIRPELDLKYSEGGLLDIELAAQTALLVGHSGGCETTVSVLEKLGWQKLKDNYAELRTYEQLSRLLNQTSSSRWNDSLNQQICILTGIEDVELKLRTLLSENLDFLRHQDPRRLSKNP